MSDDLRTDDDVARLFAQANPVPRSTTGDRARPRTSLEARREVTIDLHGRRPERVAESRHRPAWSWLLPAAAVALIVSVAVAAIDQDDPATIDGTGPTLPPITTPETLPPTRLRVVDAFVAAVSAHDAAAVNRQLAPGAVPALVLGADVGDDGTASVEDQLAWLAATGAEWKIDSCREQGETGAYCTTHIRDRLSDLIALEVPATVLLGFQDGLIEQVSVTPQLDEYGPEAFRPFYQWVGTNHPADVERLWQPETRGFVPPVFTSAAAELMDVRLTEYVEAYPGIQAASTADVAAAEAFIEAFNSRDEAALASLVADSRVLTADLLGDTDPATYLAWFDALDRRWTQPSCAHEGDVVVCRVVERDELSEATGAERSTIIRLSIADGLVADVSIVADEGQYVVRALEPFVEWVAATHPEDLRAMWDLPPGAEHVRANRNEATIPLFEAHVDEWTSGPARPTPAHRTLLEALASGDREAGDALLSSDTTVDLLWAASADDLPGLSELLEGLEWSWNVESCSVSRNEPDPERPELTCVAAPTSRLEPGVVVVRPMVVEFAFTSDGIAFVSTGPWLERATADWSPLFDWIRSARPDDAGVLLGDRDGVTVPVLTDAAVERFLELVDEYVARSDG